MDPFSAASHFGDNIGHIWPIFMLIGGIIAGMKWARIRWKAAEVKIKQEVRDIVVEELNADNPVNAKLENLEDWHAANKVQLAEDFKAITSQITTLQGSVEQNAARTRTLQAAGSAPIYEIDENVKLVYVNKAYCDLFEVTYSEAMKGDWIAHIAPEDQEKLANDNNTAFTDHTMWTEDYTVIGARTGKRKHVIARAFPLFDGDEFLGWVGGIIETDPDSK